MKEAGIGTQFTQHTPYRVATKNSLARHLASRGSIEDHDASFSRMPCRYICDRREAIGEPPLEHKRILFSICPPLIFFWWRVERLVDSAASMWTLLVLSTWLLCCNCASPRGRPLCILTCWVVQMVIRLCRLRDFRSAFELWYILPSLDEPRCLSMA